jgi:hypothetical protein
MSSCSGSRSVNSILEFFKGILKSRLGRALFAIHFVLATCAYLLHLTSRPTPATLFDEPLLLQAVYWLDFPTIFVSAWLASPVLYERRYEEYGVLQWLAVGIIVLSILGQWWIIGYIIERLWVRSGKLDS